MDLITQIREFNRFYTSTFGLLSRNYLGSGKSVAEIRLLYELVEQGTTTARTLSQRLDLDEGYVSRSLASAEQKGWITRARDPNDGRAHVLSPTETGKRQVEGWVQQSREEIATRLLDISPAQKEHLSRALVPLKIAFDGNHTEIPVLRDLKTGDAGWLIQQHAERYAADEGFDASFEPLVADILTDFIRSHDPTCERGWIAEVNGHRLGSIFCVRLTESTAKLRLFYVDPLARGKGVGRQLLTTCMSYAQACGYQKMQLWTHESHTAACALYKAHGWVCTSSKPVHSFGVDLVEQSWEVTL